MILFRGREQSRPEQGVRLLRKFAEDVAEFGTVESNPTIDGRNMVMVVAPAQEQVRGEDRAERPARCEQGGRPLRAPTAVRRRPTTPAPAPAE